MALEECVALEGLALDEEGAPEGVAPKAVAPDKRGTPEGRF